MQQLQDFVYSFSVICQSRCTFIWLRMEGQARNLLSSRRNSQHHRPAVRRGRSTCCSTAVTVAPFVPRCNCFGLFAVLRWSLICVGLYHPLTPGNFRLHRNLRVKELKDVVVSGIHEAVRESVEDRVGRRKMLESVHACISQHQRTMGYMRVGGSGLRAATHVAGPRDTLSPLPLLRMAKSRLRASR